MLQQILSPKVVPSTNLLRSLKPKSNQPSKKQLSQQTPRKQKLTKVKLGHKSPKVGVRLPLLLLLLALRKGSAQLTNLPRARGMLLRKLHLPGHQGE